MQIALGNGSLKLELAFDPHRALVGFIDDWMDVYILHTAQLQLNCFLALRHLQYPETPCFSISFLPPFLLPSLPPPSPSSLLPPSLSPSFS